MTVMDMIQNSTIIGFVVAFYFQNKFNKSMMELAKAVSKWQEIQLESAEMNRNFVEQQTHINNMISKAVFGGSDELRN